MTTLEASTVSQRPIEAVWKDLGHAENISRWDQGDQNAPAEPDHESRSLERWASEGGSYISPPDDPGGGMDRLDVAGDVSSPGPRQPTVSRQAPPGQRSRSSR